MGSVLSMKIILFVGHTSGQHSRRTSPCEGLFGIPRRQREAFAVSEKPSIDGLHGRRCSAAPSLPRVN